MITKKKKREELQYLRDEALDAYMNRPDFQYDANGDALYRHYKDRYTQLGKRAMQDTMRQATVLTGGYGSSYAQNVGQQAYNSYMQQLGDVVPELYQLAYDRYRDKGDRLYKAYQSWSQLEQQAAQQEQWEREYELEERKRQDANREFQLEQERKNSQTQTSQTQTAAYQPDYWASLAAYHKLGQNNSTAAVDTTAAEPAYDNGKVSEGNVKTMQRVLGLPETGKWTDLERTGAGGLSADDAWKDYQQGKLQNRKSVGLGDQGLANGNVKAMERMLGLKEDGYWSEEDKQAAGGLSEANAWDAYQRGLLRKRNTQVNNKVLTEGDIKSMERVLGLTEDGVWSEEDQKATKGFSAATAWEAYQSGSLQRWKYKGLFEQGLSDGTDKEKKESEKTAKETQFQVKGVSEGAAWEKKYSGMTYSELRNAINNLEDGSEKDWVITNVLGLTTQLDYTKALQKTKGELGYAMALQDEYQRLTKRLRVIDPGSEEAKKLITRKAEIYSQFGDLDDYIDRLNTDVWWMERDAKYKFIEQNQDFAELSKEDPHSMGWLYTTVNEPTKARRWETAAYIHGLAPLYDALNYDNLHYMEDEERAIFNYLYAKEGKDAAKEYLDYLQYELNKRSADFWNEGATDLTQKNAFTRTAASLLSTPVALMGSNGLGDATVQKFMSDVAGKYKPIDYNRDAMLPAQLQSTIRDTMEQDIEDATGVIDFDDEKYPMLSWMLDGKSLGDLYQLAMDILDSAAVDGLSLIHPAVREVATAVSSDSIGTKAMLDAVEKGATDEQALTTGILRGLLEMVLAKANVGELLKIDKEIMRKVVDLALSKGLDGVFDNLEFRKKQE